MSNHDSQTARGDDTAADAFAQNMARRASEDPDKTMGATQQVVTEGGHAADPARSSIPDGVDNRNERESSQAGADSTEGLATRDPLAEGEAEG